MGGFPDTPELTRDGACVSYVIGRRRDHVDAIGRVIKETEKGGIGFVQTSETVLLESDGRLPIDTHTPASIAPPLLSSQADLPLAPGQSNTYATG